MNPEEIIKTLEEHDLWFNSNGDEGKKPSLREPTLREPILINLTLHPQHGCKLANKHPVQVIIDIKPLPEL